MLTRVSFFKNLILASGTSNGQNTTRVLPGLVAQSVGSPNVYPGVSSLIPAQPHTFVEIDNEIISTVILCLPLVVS